MSSTSTYQYLSKYAIIYPSLFKYNTPLLYMPYDPIYYSNLPQKSILYIDEYSLLPSDLFEE